MMATSKRRVSSAEMLKGNCLARLQSTAAAKQNGSARIASFILSNPARALEMTITELSESIHTSASSLSRFCERIGYKTFRDFRNDLAASITARPPDVSGRFNLDDDDATIVERVFQMNQMSLTDTRALLDIDGLARVVEAIAGARRVYLIGQGSSALIARLAAQRFESLGIATMAMNDPYEILLSLPFVTEKDMLVAISHTGKTEMIIKQTRLASGRGATTVAITNYLDSPLAQACDVALITSFSERSINAAVSSSAIAQMCLVDALYFVLARHQGSVAEHVAEDIENAAESALRSAQQ